MIARAIYMLLFLGSASVASIDLFGAVLLGGPYLSGMPQLWQAIALVVSWLSVAGLVEAFGKYTTNGKAAPEQQGPKLVVVGYATNKELVPLLDETQPDGSYVRIGLDHPTLWLEDEPYDHLVPLYMIEGSMK